ncbi:MAG: hypothetical protein ABIF77_08295 [bacterium]
MALFGIIAATILFLFGFVCLILLVYGAISPSHTLTLGFIKKRKHVLCVYIPAIIVFTVGGVVVQKVTRPPKIVPVTVEVDPGAELRLAERIAELEAEAKAIPGHDSQRNIDAYHKLLALDPGNLQYQAKVVHYEAQLAGQMSQWDTEQNHRQHSGSRSSSQQRQREAKHGPKPNVNALDNSVYEVKFYLQGSGREAQDLEVRQVDRIGLFRNRRLARHLRLGIQGPEQRVHHHPEHLRPS